MKSVACRQPKSKRYSMSAQGMGFGVGRGKEVAKKEATDAVWAQMVKSLEKFAMEFGLYPVGNGELWKVFKGVTLSDKVTPLCPGVEQDSSGSSSLWWQLFARGHCYILVFSVPGHKARLAPGRTPLIPSCKTPMLWPRWHTLCPLSLL